MKLVSLPLATILQGRQYTDILSCNETTKCCSSLPCTPEVGCSSKIFFLKPNPDIMTEMLVRWYYVLFCWNLTAKVPPVHNVIYEPVYGSVLTKKIKYMENF